MRVFSIDPGTVHCGFCCLSLQHQTTRCPPSLESLEGCLDRGDVVVHDWGLVQLASSRHATAASTYDKALEFLRRSDATLRDADLLVIETQMTSRMKCVSACFYTAARCLYPQLQVLFQSASCKLNFADLHLFIRDAAPASYASRKKAAVTAARRLADSPAFPPGLAQTFKKERKKDDLADALLHALAALCLHAPPETAGEPPSGNLKRRRAVTAVASRGTCDSPAEHPKRPKAAASAASPSEPSSRQSMEQVGASTYRRPSVELQPRG
jgi:hypothetical protein